MLEFNDPVRRHESPAAFLAGRAFCMGVMPTPL
jgi:hypothetical protein